MKTESNPIQNYSQHSPHMGNSSKFHIKSIENKAASIHRLKYELKQVNSAISVMRNSNQA